MTVDAVNDGDLSTVDIQRRSLNRIFKCWNSYKNRRIFIYLRHAICRAEQSLTHQVDILNYSEARKISDFAFHQVLRKISPQEASLLKDPTLNARLRFRFAGENYPPVIMYKIFINANVQVRTAKIYAMI
jgi:hypothetical protein